MFARYRLLASLAASAIFLADSSSLRACKAFQKSEWSCRPWKNINPVNMLVRNAIESPCWRQIQRSAAMQGRDTVKICRFSSKRRGVSEMSEPALKPKMQNVSNRELQLE